MGNGGWQRLYFTDPVFGAAARRQQIVDRLARADIGYDDVRMDVFTVRCAHPDDLVVLDQKRINLHSGAGLSTRFDDRRNQMFGKGLAATHRIPRAAFQITAADQGMDGKACLVRAAPMIPPLCGKGRGKVWILRDAVDNLLRRAGTPFFDGPVIPPFNHVTDKVGHGAG